MKKYLIPLLLLTQCLLAESDPLQRLIDGNRRFYTDRLEHPDRSSESREAVAATQRPFAIIVSCSDSRVAPEIIFDQGIGDLFVVRVAGNVVGPLELDSIEFALLHLGSVIVMVLGHENCGAVDAVLHNQTQDIESIARLIRPAIKKAGKGPGDDLKKAIEANVRHVVDYLKKSRVVSSYVKKGKLEIVGGYYDLTTGKVSVLN